jgi:hypothetical protein
MDGLPGAVEGVAAVEGFGVAQPFGEAVGQPLAGVRESRSG